MAHVSLGFPFHFSLFVSSSRDDSMCGLTVTLWGNPAKSMCGCFHLHGQAGSWDLLGCTIFMGGGHILLDSEAPPCLVCGDWAISREFLRFAVFMNEKLDLWIYFACWPFSAALSQAFWKECLTEMPESVWVPSHSLVCLSSVNWYTQQHWFLCLTHLSLHPFKFFTASWSGVWGFSAALKHALICCTFRLACISGRSSMNCMVSVVVSLVVPSVTLIALFCTLCSF